MPFKPTKARRLPDTGGAILSYSENDEPAVIAGRGDKSRAAASDAAAHETFLKYAQNLKPFMNARAEWTEKEVWVMPFRRAFAVKLLVAGAALAQTPEAGLRSQIATVRYAPPAELARIQGDVHLKLNLGVVTVLSGHPLLAPIAVESAKSFGPVQGRTELDVKYHFVLVDTAVLTSTIVKRGNAIERAVLRMFGLKTERVVYGCQEGIPPANDVKLAVPVIDIWIYGRTRCLQTQAATLVARR